MGGLFFCPLQESRGGVCHVRKVIRKNMNKENPADDSKAVLQAGEIPAQVNALP